MPEPNIRVLFLLSHPFRYCIARKTACSKTYSRELFELSKIDTDPFCIGLCAISRFFRE